MRLLLGLRMAWLRQAGRDSRTLQQRRGDETAPPPPVVGCSCARHRCARAQSIADQLRGALAIPLLDSTVALQPIVCNKNTHAFLPNFQQIITEQANYYSTFALRLAFFFTPANVSVDYPIIGLKSLRRMT